MSANTERDLSFKVSYEGGFPTAEEFDGVDRALADINESGLDLLLRRIARPLVEAFEGDEDATVEFTYADVGLLSAKAYRLVETAEWVLEAAKKLQAIAEDVGESVECGGRVENAPKFSALAGEYQPSQDALERWGLAKPKEDSLDRTLKQLRTEVAALKEGDDAS